MSKEETKEELKLPWRKGLPGWLLILINIGLIIVVGLLLLWGAMAFLQSYTRHGKAIRTPDITGLSVGDAEALLKRENLYMEVVDSIYVEGKTPGIVLDTTPKPGSRIKPKRVIFVTVNTMNVKSILLPQFEELSERSVEMMLRGAGFKNITTEYVPGEHHLLVLRLKDNTGHYLRPGERIPYNTQLIMEVSSADMYETAIIDSLQGQATGTEDLDPIGDTGTTTGEDWF